jgi:NAD(P)-dependent dehydrogenase (short-subunit alcohol dehydrogenase family)
MGDRLKGKTAIIAGGGQTPGETIGNGRAMAVLFAREGARVLVVDRRLSSAQQTQAMIESEGGQAFALQADITQNLECRSIAETCLAQYGRIDILVNNVGIGDRDGGPVELEEEIWDRVFTVNLKGMYLTCKHVLPVMERQGSGAIVNISSIAAVCSARMLAYKTSKSGVNSFTHAVAMRYASKGVRVNAIMPGLMKTPMAIQGISKASGIEKEELIRRRDKAVPLKGGMGDAWDTAYAALFLVSDEAKFITGVILPVDGGQSARIG